MVLLFPERQLYFRSNGDVKFVALTTPIQGLIAIVLLGLVGWMGFATIDHYNRQAILDGKDKEINALASTNDKLGSDIASLQKDITSKTSVIEKRQEYLTEIISGDPDLKTAKGEVKTKEEIKAGSNKLETDEGSSNDDGSDGGFDFFGINAEKENSYFDQLDEIRQTAFAQLDQVEANQVNDINAVINKARLKIFKYDTALKTTGLSTDNLIAAWEKDVSNSAMGGPFIPASLPLANLSEGAELSAADKAVMALNEEWIKLQKIKESIESVPSIAPPEKYYVSSPFGRRIDPFRKVPANHPGIDLAGWRGTDIKATAPGKIVRAGPWKTYGRMVEIDHGNGFKTRYGHMQKLRVKVGQTIERGQSIGDLGCTGRCTSPHVHYEVWFQGRLKDPMPYLRVAETVFKLQNNYNVVKSE
jgi:murein DD-endopeptidase MepM/ murein hydrolase activator NlpD